MKTLQFISCMIALLVSISTSLAGEEPEPLTIVGHTAEEILENGEVCYIWRHHFDPPASLTTIKNLGTNALITLPDDEDWYAVRQVMNGTLKQFMRMFRRFVKVHGREPQLIEIPPEAMAILSEEPLHEVRELFRQISTLVIVSFEAPTGFQLTLQATKGAVAANQDTP